MRSTIEVPSRANPCVVPACDLPGDRLAVANETDTKPNPA
jgi:hypothetical protein